MESRSKSSRLIALLVFLAVLVVVVVVVLVGGGDDEEGSSTGTETTAEGECAEVEAPEPKDVSFERAGEVLERGDAATAVVETSCGSFTIELDTENSPKTANSFAFLAEEGFYDDTVFHRIAPGFVIQGGDPQGSDPAVAGGGGPGYSVTEAPPQDTSYTRGLVAMAKTEVEPPGTSGSQFFVVTAPADAGLPPDYAVLGEVSEGIEVVEAIGELGDASEQPTQTVVVDSISIEQG
jgi:cyclophilin family peptidyl-prolyl cis-trans isomerase